MMSRILKVLQGSNWGFWLFLPLIAALLWILGSLMTERVLTRSYGSLDKLQANTEARVDEAELLLAINAVIDRRRGVTTVFVKMAALTENTLKYELPMVEVAQLETAIAQKINVSVDTVRKLTSYQIQND